MKITLEKEEVDAAIKAYVNPMLSNETGQSVDVSVSRTQGGYIAEVAVGHEAAPGNVEPLFSSSEKPAAEASESDEDDAKPVFG